MATVELTDEQEEARVKLAECFGAFVVAMQEAETLGLQATAIIGQQLRDQMGDEFNSLPPQLRMLL